MILTEELAIYELQRYRAVMLMYYRVVAMKEMSFLYIVHGCFTLRKIQNSGLSNAPGKAQRVAPNKVGHPPDTLKNIGQCTHYMTYTKVPFSIQNL